ncbi:MAG: DUF6020 family protein [Saccharofermentans sp.]|nr:DUF6020 family protein [Saccharofermentans sp.]
MRKDVLLKIYIAFIFSGFTVFPLYYNVTEKTRSLMGIASLFIWFAVADIVMRVVNPLKKIYSTPGFQKIDSAVRSVGDLPFFLICWGLVIVMWTPAFCSMFPGTFGYDAPVQLLEWQGKIELGDQHPITHTVLIGLLYDFVTKVLGGTPNAGIALYIAVQALIVSGAIAYCLLTFRRCGVHSVGIMLTFLWFACNPFIQVLTMNSTKDILFGAFLSLFLLVFWQILRSGKWSTKSAVCFVVFGILTCLFRHQGIYFFAALLLFLLIAPRYVHIAKKQMVSSVAVVIAFFEIFSFVCHSVMNIKPGDSREMLSVPMQQMAYVCMLKIEGQDINVSGAQLKQVETFIPEAGIMDYQKNTADNVKATFSTEAFTEDISENALTYIKLGLQNPDKYLYAFRNLTEGYIDSDDMGYKSLMFMYSFRVAENEQIQRSPLMFDGYLDILTNSTLSQGYQRTPLMSVLFKPSLCVWILAVMIGLVFYRRDYKLWLVALPILLLCISLFLGPVALIRYLYPMILLVPFMVMCIIKPV